MNIMARKHEFIKLSGGEESKIRDMLSKGVYSSRSLVRAQILLLNHQGRNTDEIAEVVPRSKSSVYNVIKAYKQVGLEGALHDKPRSGRPKQISAIDRAKITALACTDAPKGHLRWTMRLLADKAVELDYIEKGKISHMTVHRLLKKTT